MSMVLAWCSALMVLKLERHQYHELSAEQLTQAKNYLDGKLTPEPSGWQWQTFSPEPGVKLRTGMVEAENAKGTIIFVPGFTATLEMAMRTIGKLNTAGYRVAAIEYRGQGRSWRPLENPEKGYVENYQQLANDVALFAKQSQLKGKPLFFFSISKGAHISLRAVADSTLDVSALALVVPMIKINTGGVAYDSVAFIAKAASLLGLGEMYAPTQAQWPPKPLVFGVGNGCNANPETAQLQSALFSFEKNLRTRGTTFRWLKETTASTQRLLSGEFNDALTLPIKMFTAGDDRIVNTSTTHQFCDSLSNCDARHFKQSRHCINREDLAVMDEIIAESIALFNRTLDTNKSQH